MGYGKLNFQEICEAIPPKALLDFLDVSYTETQQGELKGRTRDYSFVWQPKKEVKGNKIDAGFFKLPQFERISAINIYGDIHDVEVLEGETKARAIAHELKINFLTDIKKRKLPEYKLEHTNELKELGFTLDHCQKYNFGYCKKGVHKGRIAFRLPTGHYMGYKDGKWYYPRKNWGFERNFIYNYQADGAIVLTTDLIQCIKLDIKGLKASCIIGKHLTEHQVMLLEGRKIVLADDIESNIVKLARVATVRVADQEKIKEWLD